MVFAQENRLNLLSEVNLMVSFFLKVPTLCFLDSFLHLREHPDQWQ